MKPKVIKPHVYIADKPYRPRTGLLRVFTVILLALCIFLAIVALRCSKPLNCNEIVIAHNYYTKQYDKVCEIVLEENIQ